MRRTRALNEVAVALLENPRDRHWGYELSRASGVRSGVIYPLLRRLLEQGLLIDGWEDPAKISGRPPRRYYQLTDAGRAELAAVAHAAQAEGSAREAYSWGFAR